MTASLATPGSQAPDVLCLLADDIRWRLVRALARSDYRVGELTKIVNKPYNLVSYHLRRLKQQRVVVEHRSARDNRDIYYSLDLGRLRWMYFSAADSVHPAVIDQPATAEQSVPHAIRSARVLILCTHNSARSQMAEGILRHIGGGRVEVFSAGSQPSTVKPEAVGAMSRMGIDISAQYSKSLDEFVGQSFDYVITVCDSVREQCPVFPGDPERIHWSFPDPSDVTDPVERARAFDQTALGLMTRLRQLLTLIERERGAATT